MRQGARRTALIQDYTKQSNMTMVGDMQKTKQGPRDELKD